VRTSEKVGAAVAVGVGAYLIWKLAAVLKAFALAIPLAALLIWVLLAPLKILAFFKAREMWRRHRMRRIGVSGITI
jgi:hypothetical protein